MSKVLTTSIFTTTVAQQSWRTKIISGAVHVAVIGLAFLLAVPAVQILKKPEEHVSLVAPILPKYHPKLVAPRLPHVAKLTLPTPPKIEKPVILPPVTPPPAPVAKVVPPPPAPVVHTQPRIEAEAKPNPQPPAPKPVVKTGSFADAQLAKAAPAPKPVVIGGFGDPRSPQSNPDSKQTLMAKVGSFDKPLGDGSAGAGGHSDAGSIKQAGFGSVSGNSAANAHAANVRTGGFGDNAGSQSTASGNGTVRQTAFGQVVNAPQRHDAISQVAAFTPVEILFKPRPAYSTEARNIGLEGQVSLEVVFQASGAVRVVRVLKGLGHGLDEAAAQAAAQVRFKPATRSGSPVDTNATISITFELS